MPDARWEFLKYGAGILPASNMADPLRSSHLRAVEVLVREAVQNSLDERRSDLRDPVRVRFERFVLTGQEKQRFVAGLGLGQIVERQEYFRSSHAWFDAGRRELEAIDDPDVGVPVLAISDFNARGLGGRWNRLRSRNDRFFNLVLSIGGSLKWDTDEDDAHPRSLGSYGFGKMAFAMCSRVRTVLYYSTFLPDADTSGVSCRAMASAFLPPHTIDDVDFAGQSFFGLPCDEEGVPAGPLVDSQAHSWIRELGIAERTDEETGTTVVIPAAFTTMEEIVDACATWWWPRMGDPDLQRRVQFEFVDEGQRLPDCRPRSHAGLSPFLDCYRQAAGPKAGEGYEIANIQVRPKGVVRSAGRLVLKALDRQEPYEGPEDHQQVNRIALVRDGLVIAYAEGLAHEDKTPVVGVFIPAEDPESERAFVLSEPPSHDAWEENAERLRDKYSWGRDFIRLTKSQLKTKTRDFQARHAPPSETERTTAGAFLRKSLGDLFVRRRPPIPPPPRYRAFTIETRESGRRPGRPAEDYVTYALGLSDHAPVTEQNAVVMLSLSALADADGTRSDTIPCEITASDGSKSGPNGAPLMTTLRKGQTTLVTARGRVHPAWKTMWDLEVTRSRS